MKLCVQIKPPSKNFDPIGGLVTEYDPVFTRIIVFVYVIPVILLTRTWMKLYPHST